jgi:dTDP-4-amino-4,6-dideoxygalactose transaminase
MIPLFEIKNDIKDVAYFRRVIERGESWAQGKEIEEFENKFAKYLGTKCAVACNSGTSALHATMLLLGIGEGDEVIVPSFTFIATANAPLFVGATPVFADIEEETYGLDPNNVIMKITEKTKAIIAVHVGGCPCKIKELKEIADDYGLFLIEDACEAMGAKIGNKKVGTFGDISIFSLCQNKLITTGEGGMLAFSKKIWYKGLKRIISHGQEGIDFVQLGYNWRMPTALASLGISQLNKLESNIRDRRNNAHYLLEKLSSGERIPEDYFHVYQLFTLRFGNRDQVKKYLEKKGISSKVYFNPIHLTTFYKLMGHKVGELPVTEKVAKEVLTLPMYPELSKDEMGYIAKHVWKKIS